MSIFVDENDTFPIDVWYDEVRDERGKLRHIDVSETLVAGWAHLRGHFCQPGSEVFGVILEDATIINSISLKPILQTRRLRDLVLLKLMKQWAIVDDAAADPEAEEAETKLPLNAQSLGTTHWLLTNHLFVEYMTETKMEDAIEVAVEQETMR